MKARKVANITALEKYFDECRRAGNEMVWRITETPNWYNIQAEIEEINEGSEVAYYQTDKWSEIVEFCASHCNPGYDSLNGLGCTDSELYNATRDYVRSMGKKMRYE